MLDEDLIFEAIIDSLMTNYSYTLEQAQSIAMEHLETFTTNMYQTFDTVLDDIIDKEPPACLNNN